jgi:hypothetical protein
MSSLDAVPADPKAVLQLLRGKGKAYEELFGLLDLEADAVRSHDYDALDALAGGPRGLNVRRGTRSASLGTDSRSIAATHVSPPVRITT